MSGLNLPLLTPESNERATVPQFTQLPIEIRDMIWKEALIKDRVLNIHFFHVNAESRRAGKRYYRVHIPCTYMKPGRYEKGTLYIRPESDTICMGLTEGFGRFAHCVWALDHLHVGLVNLAPDLKSKGNRDCHWILALADGLPFIREK
uniref:2EXR domain-containing protein n=1 Tax=Fusarium oxysporum (strain Fo5176) TaxID=660025 RepID=A0A0D2YA71_FUSOF